MDLAAAGVWGAETTFVSEVDLAASRVLKRRFPGAVNVGDISTADWAAVDSVELRNAGLDFLTMGIPCQPVSQAKAEFATAESERWLWDQARRAVHELSPETVFFENVKNLLVVDGGRAWEQILADLVFAGYGVRWLTIGACAVGAPHHRHRIFLLAQKRLWSRVERVETAECGLSAGDRLLPTPTAREGTRRGPGSAAYWRERARTSRQGKESPPLSALIGILAEEQGEQRDLTAFWFGEFEPAVRRWEAEFGPAPFPTYRGPNGGLRLAPEFGEWLMGWEPGFSACDAVTRREQLRLIGNGVCVPQAVRALELLTAQVRTPPPPAPLPPREVVQKEVAHGVMHATRLAPGVSDRFREEASRRGLRPAQLQRIVLTEFVEGLGEGA